jgi:hypothetical protein
MGRKSTGNLHPNQKMMKKVLELYHNAVKKEMSTSQIAKLKTDTQGKQMRDKISKLQSQCKELKKQRKKIESKNKQIILLHYTILILATSFHKFDKINNL